MKKIDWKKHYNNLFVWFYNHFLRFLPREFRHTRRRLKKRAKLIVQNRLRKNKNYRKYMPNLYARNRGKCEQCQQRVFKSIKTKEGKPIKQPNTGTIDHIIPIRDGGTNEFSNLRLLCNDCHKAINRIESWQKKDPWKNQPFKELLTNY